MNPDKALIEQVAKFKESYAAKEKDVIWQQHSLKFRKFWSERVMQFGTGPISDDECDQIIRILDSRGRGNRKGDEAVGNTIITQFAWRKMLNDIHERRRLAEILDSIFSTAKLREAKIDELYEVNKDNKNRLTSEAGVAINTLLAAFDPTENLTIISLRDRKAQIDFLNLQIPFDWESASVGKRIVQTNTLVREATRALGIDGSARTLSRFWYFPPVKDLWKPEHTVKRSNKKIAVTVPEDPKKQELEETDRTNAKVELRESLQMQAILAEIGATMGFKIWLPKSDRARIGNLWKPVAGQLFDKLPGNYESAMLKTIEQIDVIWLRKNAIVRAFEVEHTTAVYSGLLRMADLLALQPNLNIKLHIVAPEMKRNKVFQEIRRPVFQLRDGKPLAELCTYLSYKNINEIRNQKLLNCMSDEVLEHYEESAQEEETD
jgi:hypothetical protein